MCTKQQNEKTCKGLKIWINAGEASGDMHGALLVKALKDALPDACFTGMGGPAMEEQGVTLRYPMELISLVGLTEVIGGLPKIITLLDDIKRDLTLDKPDAIVLLDCPDFNFRVAKIAHKLGIPVYYYISPQIWAWRTGRVKFLQKYVRKVMCILPFEKDFYAQHGMEVDYVGHPLLDQVPIAELDTMKPKRRKIGLLPGSRNKEISTLMPIFAKTARELFYDEPLVSFSIIRAPGVSAERLREYWPQEIPVEFVGPEDRYQGMRSCEMLFAASGTVTLESALLGVPTVVGYQLSAVSFAVAQVVIKVDYASLPNLILDKEVFPELLQGHASVENFTAYAKKWLNDEEAINTVRNDLTALRTMVGEPGAPKRAAEIIINDLDKDYA
ncbi:MAG: lipid-A-disaccharide synthase [Desulfovibrio sp.]